MSKWSGLRGLVPLGLREARVVLVFAVLDAQPGHVIHDCGNAVHHCAVLAALRESLDAVLVDLDERLGDKLGR